MQTLLGIAFFVFAIVALMVARPKNGRPRSFVGTPLEPYVGIAIVTALGAGLVMTIQGIAEALG